MTDNNNDKKKEEKEETVKSFEEALDVFAQGFIDTIRKPTKWIGAIFFEVSEDWKKKN